LRAIKYLTRFLRFPQKKEDLALWVLLSKIAHYIKAASVAAPSHARVIIDEGWKKAGIGMSFPAELFQNVFLDPAVLFVKSNAFPPVQAADGVGFMWNRMQISQGRHKVKRIDLVLAGITNGICPLIEDILPKAIQWRDVVTGEIQSVLLTIPGRKD
jgi:hypothetical protein